MTRLTRQVVQAVSGKVLLDAQIADLAISTRHEAIDYVWIHRPELQKEMMEAAVCFRKRKKK